MLEAFDKNLLADYSGVCNLITNQMVDNRFLVTQAQYRCIQGTDSSIYLHATPGPNNALLFLFSAFNPKFITSVTGNLIDDGNAILSSNGNPIHTTLS